jgi:acyl-homoserine-lactone acylase
VTATVSKHPDDAPDRWSRSVSRRRVAVLLAALTVTVGPTAFATEHAPTKEPGMQTLGTTVDAGGSAYDVTVRYTEYGIPHIQAEDYASLGYGYGYALADQTICTLADTYTTVRAERSQFFGPDAGYVFRGNGASVNNLNSDFFFQQIIDEGRVEALLEQPVPHGPKPEIRQAVRGYVDGYNRWLQEVGGSDGVPDPTCAGQPWVREISEIDAYRRFYQLALLASSGVAIDGIGGAQPPHPSAPVPAPSYDEESAARLLAEQWEGLAIGSNAVAVGSEATENGSGLLLGNPHFPWLGSERFFQAHLTIPGTLDVAGGSLLGVPIVLIGHTERMAWSHTVSTAFRFTPFQLTLVPGSPTTYLYDGVPTPMTSREVTVQTPDGPQSRTLYSTRYGPVLTSLLGLPIFPWTPTTAFAMGDANAPNFRYLNHFFDVDHAQSSAEVLDVLERHQGIPWVNTIAADDQGVALYADISVTPHVTDDMAVRCNTAMGQATFAALRLPVLDGARSECNWGTDPDALQPGTFGPSSMPSLLRTDYVSNMNDSHWLAQPRSPLTGYPRIMGDEETARSLRTRSGLVMLEEQLAGGDWMHRQEMQDLLLSNRQHAGELTRDDVVAMCRAFPGGVAPSSSGPTPVRDSCDVLAGWDLRDDLESRGAILFRRFWTRAQNLGLPASVPAGMPNPLWRTPFDPEDPVDTPRDLNTGLAQVQVAFGDAIRDLDGAGIALDAPLGRFQQDARPDSTVTPYHGGPGGLGVFNAMAASWDASRGYVGPLAHGSSFIQAVSFDGSGCPDARTILTYSQSTNPTSEHFADQTELFSRKGWVQSRFCADDVAAGTLRSVHLVG